MRQLTRCLTRKIAASLSNVIILLLLVVFALPIPAVASLQVFMTEGETKMVEMSGRDLNCIKTSVIGITVGTNSKSLDVSVKQGNVFVSFKEGEKDPQDLLFMTPNGNVFTLILVPKSIPSQTVILKLPGTHSSKDEEHEPQADYVDKLKEVIKSMYHDVVPEGFSMKEENKNVLKWAGLSMTMTYSYNGAAIKGETYHIQNQTRNTIRILPNDFYEKGVLAVSVDTNDLAPKETTRVFILKRKDELDRKVKSKISSPLEISDVGK